MKLTKSKLKQIIKEEMQKEGIGAWLDRMRAAEEESAARYREKVAAREPSSEEEEEEEESGRIGGSKRKSFLGSGLGKGIEKIAREE